jgi:hypothetical protein
MKTQVTATFVSGIFKPDENVLLPDQSRVNLTIEPIIERSQATSAWEALKNRIRQRPIHSGRVHFTRDELHERR